MSHQPNEQAESWGRVGGKIIDLKCKKLQKFM
jgi:hypothetical protein